MNPSNELLLSNDVPASAQLSQLQREALVDLMYFCIHADRTLRPAEVEAVTSIGKVLHWASETSFASFSAEADQRARDALETAEARAAYLAAISDRLGTTEIKTHAVSMCRKIFQIDGDFANDEREFFVEIRQAFGWPR